MKKTEIAKPKSTKWDREDFRVAWISTTALVIIFFIAILHLLTVVNAQQTLIALYTERDLKLERTSNSWEIATNFCLRIASESAERR